MRMEKNVILLGDALEKLKDLEDCSVDMCVTSPPYYALRDYGTGKWVGGDPNCPHYRESKKSEHTATGHKRMGELGEAVGDAIYKTVCPLCGAVREDKQIGLEQTPEEYINRLADVFDEVRRVLKDNGTLWVNIGDSYNGNKVGNDNPKWETSNTKSFKKRTWKEAKPKDLIGIPWMLAFELRKRGWYLRQDIIWHKPNPMPEPVKDRCVKSHEYLFLLSKSSKYYFDYEAIQEPTNEQGKPRVFGAKKQKGTMRGDIGRTFVPHTKNCQYDGQRPNSMHLNREMGIPDTEYYVRNKRDVWSINVHPTKEAHFATFPPDLIIPCILAGSKQGGVVLDPFMGSGTTALVAKRLLRNYIGIELNPEYKALAERRINAQGNSLFEEV